MFDKQKQLIIIGNGFDLQCGLKSKFVDYLDFRTKERGDYPWVRYSQNHSKLSIDANRAQNAVNNSAIVPFLWDIVFSIELENNNWVDVEYTIQRWVTDDKQIGILIQIAKLTFGKMMPLVKPNIEERYYIQMYRNISISEFRGFLFEHLRRLEADFKDYLKGIAEGLAYKDNASNLYDMLARQRPWCSVDYPVETDVLSFNYTRPLHFEQNGSKYPLNSLVNIHGKLEDDNIIFGFDIADISSSDYSICQFTKTMRLLTRYFDGSNFSSIFHNNYDYIKVYGHSLSDPDYSYFENIFDHNHLIDSNVILVFYYPSDKNKLKRNLVSDIYKLFRHYESRKGLGFSLLHKLVMENRLYLTALDIY
ncbi:MULTISPECIES: AbiH family protein [unclassified Bifidobacterium]|uniref:AbiH family protein n=1 Tax=unclassified Bifidobacterium TaxID=2608897 RepID=UPI001127F190|nr:MULTISPECIES: AbiH family protein [unclassified Bifidobacterium]